MAWTSSAVGEIRNGGSDTTSSGWFDSGIASAGTDWTLQNGAQYTFTSTLSAVGTTTLTTSSGTFPADTIGNAIRISGQGVYFIITASGGNTCTVDRNLGTFATTTGYIGGALASLGQAGADEAASGVAGNNIFIKYNAAAYTIGNGAANTAGNKFSTSFSSDDTVRRICGVWGYDTNRNKGNTDANRPTLSTTSNITMFLVNAHTGWTAGNIKFVGNGTGASQIGFQANNASGNGARVVNCDFTNFGQYGISMTGTLNNRVENCLIDTCGVNNGGGVQMRGIIVGCTFTNNKGSQLKTSAGGALTVVDCLIVNAAASTIGIEITLTGPILIERCTIDSATTNGIAHTGAITSRDEVTIRYCILSRCTTNGITATNNVPNIVVDRCAFYSNGTDIGPNISTDNIYGKVSLSADPFVDATNGTVANRNYGLNATSGGGADCKNVSVATPGFANTTCYEYLGAIGPQGAGMLVHPGMQGGMRG